MAVKHLTAADLRHAVLFAAFIYLAIKFIDAIAGIILVFGIIVLVSLILNPIVSWLERHRLPRILSASSMALLGLGTIFLFIWFVVPRLAEQFSGFATDFPSYIDHLHGWLRREMPSVAKRIPSADMLAGEVIRRIGPFLGGLAGYALSFANLLVSILIIFISTIFAISNPRPIVQGFLALFPPQPRQKVIDTVQSISLQMRAWALGTLFNMFLIFILTWIALTILGFKAAFLFAVLAGALELVPILGPIAAATPPVLIALVQNPIFALWVAIIYTIIQQFESNVLVPLVMGGQLKQHPLSIIFFILVMGGIYGLVGVFLAVPTAAVAKTIVNKFYIEPRIGSEENRLSEEAEQIVSG
ncbi:MAG: AI-2E family transporter [Armatimonadota bacterium]